MDDLAKTMRISAAGMRVQGARMRMIAENLANADSTAATAEGEPYRRKIMTFETILDRTIGAPTVRVGSIDVDRSPLPRRYEPGHPAADAAGYVVASNVTPMIEAADLREAQRSYEANLNVVKASKTMLQQTIDLLR